jgi:HAE1 family hydrophobic/amphiphilic exporter-1
VLGLLPLSFAVGTGAELQAALARVVVGGLLASTLITLVLIPAIYVMVAELAARRAERREAASGTGALSRA